jgi:hypothetical protein
MNDPDLDLLESELRKLNPAKAPEQLLARLDRTLSRAAASVPVIRHTAPSLRLTTQRLLWWLVPSAGVALVAWTMVWQTRPPFTPLPTGRVGQIRPSQPEIIATTEPATPLKIAHKLLDEYEAVADVPGNGPVRFRCLEWEDLVVLRDPGRGIAIERRTPRFEVIPVAFESY